VRGAALGVENPPRVRGQGARGDAFFQAITRVPA
jgi:hypothetical protein